MSNRRWCFTLNNPTLEERDVLANLPAVYIVYGEEIAPTTGTPHLQGFVIFSRTYRRTQLCGILQAHWEAAVGTSVQASTYCKKDGNFVERGELPTSPGRRTDLDQVFDWVAVFQDLNGRIPSDRELALAQPNAVVRYRHLMDVIRLRGPPPIIRVGEPRAWQSELSAELEAPADDRSIIFYVDEVGGSGKTWFQQWYYSLNPERTQILGVGRVVDLAFVIDAEKSVFLINVPRDGLQYFQYSIVEQLKDRMVFSTKYSSILKVFRHNTHVIVFTNEYPDETKLSADRIVVRVDYN